jgi:hypothetical protein
VNIDDLQELEREEDFESPVGIWNLERHAAEPDARFVRQPLHERDGIGDFT